MFLLDEILMIITLRYSFLQVQLPFGRVKSTFFISEISGRGVPEDDVGGGHVGPGALCGSAESLGADGGLLRPTGAGLWSGPQLLGSQEFCG